MNRLLCASLTCSSAATSGSPSANSPSCCSTICLTRFCWSGFRTFATAALSFRFADDSVADVEGEINGVARRQVSHVPLALHLLERVPPVELLGTTSRKEDAAHAAPLKLDKPLPHELDLVSPEPSVAVATIPY